MENLLSIEETAQKLKTHPETIRRYLRKKELTGVKIGNGWRVRESDLSAFINARVIPAKVEARP
jgi:excisionase family DNA binding protein